jgi:predicted nuclease of predicted toxin-antitoxin system
MRFKLDENLGSRSSRLFPEAGHDVETIFDEGLSGARDEIVFETCIREGRCLLTLDLDFADIVRFPPHKAYGIAVLRLPHTASLNLLEQSVRELLNMLDTEPIPGRLWIVEPGRIRIHANTNPESGDANEL